MISKCIQHTAQGPSAHQGLMYPECARIAMFSTESLDWIGLGLEIARRFGERYPILLEHFAVE